MEKTNREMMEIDLDDWIADHPNEMEDMVIERDTIRYDEDAGVWECDAHDDHSTYTMVSYDGHIVIEYSGARR